MKCWKLMNIKWSSHDYNWNKFTRKSLATNLLTLYKSCTAESGASIEPQYGMKMNAICHQRMQNNAIILTLSDRFCAVILPPKSGPTVIWMLGQDHHGLNWVINTAPNKTQIVVHFNHLSSSVPCCCCLHLPPQLCHPYNFLQISFPNVR